MKYFFYSFIVVCLFQLIAIDAFAQSNETLQKTIYVVQQGEGLYAVARKFGVPLDDLCKWNHLSKNAGLSLDQELIIYVKTENYSNPTQPTYTIQQGEGLYAIARKLGIPVNDLCQWNHLTEKSIIYAGQKLVLYPQTPLETDFQPFILKENEQTVFFEEAAIRKNEEIDFVKKSEPLQASENVRKQRQRILFFGDSMIEGMRDRIRQYAAENDHDVLNVIWYSSSTKTWAEHIDTLRYFINSFKPTYIVIVLGANELFIRDIVRTRDPYVKKILACLGHLPYVWVGPPNWKEDTGINSLIERNVGSERFFLSKNLQLRRASDGAHLVRSSAEEWMDKIALWLNNSVPQPLQMNIPKNNTQMRGRNVLLKPLKN